MLDDFDKDQKRFEAEVSLIHDRRKMRWLEKQATDLLKKKGWGEIVKCNSYTNQLGKGKSVTSTRSINTVKK